MTLAQDVKIARRFQRAIRVDSDYGDASTLEGFICPHSSANVLTTMARHISETGQGAFTWTGPYGSGKSSLVVALAALLNGNAKLREQAAALFGRRLANALWKSMPTGTKGWRIVPVVGRREDPTHVLGEALLASKAVPKRPNGGWTESRLLDAIKMASSERPKSFGGLMLVIDEMGKFLESAAQDGSDVYLFQQLAEAASRSNGRLIVIGVLHQAFDEYAHRLSHDVRDEWAKIQGRFVDLIVNTSGEEQIELISHAITAKPSPKLHKQLSEHVSQLMHRERDADRDRLANKLTNCWPLHPVVACLLGPISRRRFGQNQRSIFGFLNSSEPHGFQDFISHAERNSLYTPDQLWDYLRANLEPSILASPDGHRWALATEALERCEALGGDAIHVELLKCIAIIDLFKERSGLIASFDLLDCCLPSRSTAEIKKALNQLSRWSLTIFRKFADAHAIYAGSDFDIDQATRAALDTIDEIDFEALKSLAGLQPVLAKRHYHETGALRWFDVNIVPVNQLLTFASAYSPGSGAIGQFLLAVPTENERQEVVHEICRKAARLSDEWDIVVGVSAQSWSVLPLARELFALDSVSNNHPELAGDTVARREVTARLASMQALLEAELLKAFDSALWFRKSFSPRHLRQADLNVIASELADRRFNLSPRLHNELLNRQRPSSSAIAAQNALLRKMVIHEGEERLGIDGYPAEGGLFDSILLATKLYAQQDEVWSFRAPVHGKADPNGLLPLWDVASSFLEKNDSRSVSVAELFEIWQRPPFGVKEGLLPILAVAYMISQKHYLAVYREGIFRAAFSDVDVDYLAKDASSIQLRWMDLSESARQLLSDMAGIVREFDPSNALIHLEPIDVARGLVSIFDNLPKWTKRTAQLSANAVQIREMFKRANDPNKFLFDDLPKSLASAKRGTQKGDTADTVKKVHDGIAELINAYPAMLHRLRDILLRELQVPNNSTQALADLHDRAENIKHLTGDYNIDAFVTRLMYLNDQHDTFEPLASLVVNKPPRDWVDPDVDRAALAFAETAQKFVRAEAFAHVKGRQDKRHAMAVVVGKDTGPKSYLEEFDVTESERSDINELVERIELALEQGDSKSRSVILAALAELSARYMQAGDKKNPNGSKQALQ